MIAWTASRGPISGGAAQTPVRVASPEFVWIPQVGALGGGGGGGGNTGTAPPRRAQATGRDLLTMPMATPPDVASSSTSAVQALPLLEVTAHSLALGSVPLAGAIDAQPSVSDSRGGGDGDAVGPTRGPGNAGGDGGGLGPGHGRELGDGYAIGNGVSSPRLLRDVKPAYTSEAMHAKITGTVGLSCVVERDGSVRDCRLTRSLESAVRPRPGSPQGCSPVAV